MDEKSTVLKPGLLVSLKTSITGGVVYKREDLEASQEVAATEGAAVSKWETTKIVDDPAETEAATKARGRCRTLITSVCTNTEFGLLCAIADEEKLDQAIKDSRAHAEMFNSTPPKSGLPKTTRVEVFAIRGRIAESDSEATRAIASEMRGILDQIKRGIADCNAEDIRKAANKARSIGKMLDAETGRKVTEAIAQARAAAKEIVKQVSSGEDKTTVKLDAVKMEMIDSARYAFLDLEESADDGEVMPAASPKDVDLDEGEGEEVKGTEATRAEGLDADLLGEVNDEMAAAPEPVE